MEKNQFLLMKDGRFLPLFVTQFLGAFHDNLFKNALVVMILYRLAEREGFSVATQALLTTAAAGVMVFPFLLFSATGGQIADAFSKNKVILYIKAAECGIAVLGAASLLLTSVPLSFFTLFLLGTHSAFFAPCKYASLPELIERDELIGGNALLNIGTFLAILAGTIAGMSLMTAEHGTAITSFVLLTAAGGGFLSALRIRPIPAAHPGLSVCKNPAVQTVRGLRFVFSRDRAVVLAVLGKGWFFCIGSLFLAQMPNFVKNTLRGEEFVLTFFTVLFSAGIGFGGLLNNRLLRGAVTARFVPAAAIILGLLCFDLVRASGFVEAPPPGGGLLSLSDFLNTPAHWRVIVDVAMIAAAGGVFVVPLTAMLQAGTERETRARVVAGSSVTDSFFMVFSALAAGGLTAAGFDIPSLFLLFGAATIGVGFIYRKFLLT